MKPVIQACSITECRGGRRMAERKEFTAPSDFIDRCNSCCYRNAASSFRAETNRLIRHAYAECFMARLNA